MILFNNCQLGLEVVFLTPSYVALSATQHWPTAVYLPSSQFGFPLRLAGLGREKTIRFVRNDGITFAYRSRVWLYVPLRLGLGDFVSKRLDGTSLFHSTAYCRVSKAQWVSM